LHATIEEFAADGYTHVECWGSRWGGAGSVVIGLIRPAAPIISQPINTYCGLCSCCSAVAAAIQPSSQLCSWRCRLLSLIERRKNAIGMIPAKILDPLWGGERRGRAEYETRDDHHK
jgi:predicted nucleic acid-binding Zn ribbon protein